MLCLIFSLIKSIKNIIFIVFAIEQEPPANKKDIYQEKCNDSDSSGLNDTTGSTFEVERIIGHRSRKVTKTFYKVKWKNFDESYNEWVNEDNMNCPSLIEAYYKNKKRHLD